jgi:hypothetical protein
VENKNLCAATTHDAQILAYQDTPTISQRRARAAANAFDALGDPFELLFLV